MQPATRVLVAGVAGTSGALLLATAFSESWYHAASHSPLADWSLRSGFGGPYDRGSASPLLGAVSGIGWIVTTTAALCAILTSIGTTVGVRRDHVPRLLALLASGQAIAAIVLQASAIAMWPYAAQAKPHGFGWAMPAFFVAGTAVAVTMAILYRDARARARRSAAALAKIEREQREADLADVPGFEPDEPVERV